MLRDFFQKKKTKKAVKDPKQMRYPIEKPASKWTSWEVYSLLCRIDQGYQPTAAEASALQSRTGLDFSGTALTALPESFGQLTSLQALDLRYTRLTALPEWLENFFESWTIEGMRVENNAIVIPILPYEYHPAKKDDHKLRKALYKAYNGICPYCNKSLSDERSFEVDHIFPSHYQELPELKEYVKYLNDHGFNTAKPDYVENYFPAHHSCNLDKSNHTEPFALLAWHHRAARMAPKVLRLMEEQKKTR